MFEIKLFMHYTLITTVNYNLESAQIKFHQGYTKDRPHNYPWYWEGETLPLQIKRKMVSRYYRFYANFFSFFLFLHCRSVCFWLSGARLKEKLWPQISWLMWVMVWPPKFHFTSLFQYIADVKRFFTAHVINDIHFWNLSLS